MFWSWFMKTTKTEGPDKREWLKHLPRNERLKALLIDKLPAILTATSSIVAGFLFLLLYLHYGGTLLAKTAPAAHQAPLGTTKAPAAAPSLPPT
jgi:hypothetical protein